MNKKQKNILKMVLAGALSLAVGFCVWLMLMYLRSGIAATAFGALL